MHRTHKPNDPRCQAVSDFECPTCEDRFFLPQHLEEHVRNIHDLSSTMPSLISQADDSTWKYFTCNLCEGKFENEMDLSYHTERVHEYGEQCTLYPCDECGYQGRDIVELKKHKESEHTVPLYTRREQNLQNINFQDDSNDDLEWNPNDDEILLA